MVDPAHKGKVFPPYSYTVERGKVREFMLAIGDERTDSMGDDLTLPPTFATVFAFWGGLNLEAALKEVGIEIWNVLHAEQEYEYLASIHIGDTVTGQLQIADIYTKGGRSGQLEFVDLLLEYRNQHGALVLREKSSIIVRG
jgi:hypothetical protein